MKKKLVYLVLGIIGFAVLVVTFGEESSISPVSNVPDENVSFIKTDKNEEFSERIGNLYRNTKYKFRIKFPENWEIKAGDGPNIVQKAIKENSSVSVGVREIPTEYGDAMATIRDISSLVEFKDGIIGGVQQKVPGAKLLDYGETKLDNVTTYWVKYSASYSALDKNVEGIYLQYQLLHSNVMYSITASTLADEFPSMEPAFKESVATFVIENY